MKLRIILCAFALLSLVVGCKDNKVAEEPKAAVEQKNTFTLTNLTDENWQKGVGIKYKMFLTDYTKEKEEMIKNGKTMELADGQLVTYLGSEVIGTYIQIYLNEDTAKYKAAAEFPNEIKIK